MQLTVLSRFCKEQAFFHDKLKPGFVRLAVLFTLTQYCEFLHFLVLREAHLRSHTYTVHVHITGVTTFRQDTASSLESSDVYRSVSIEGRILMKVGTPRISRTTFLMVFLSKL